MLRLSSELADVQSQCGDYYILEPETDQGESGFQSFHAEEVRSPSPVESSSSLNTTSAPMSPDELSETPVDENDDTRTLISDQPAEIKIKRTSSGKSPSKIPRFVGNSDDPRAAQISYYMSLKRGLKSPGSSQAKFYIQVQNSHNPYMHLMRSENLARKKLYDSQSTVDSELEDSPFETYLQPDDHSIDGEEFHAQLGELVTLHLENRSLAPSVTRTEQESLSDRSSVGSFTEPAVSPNPIYQTVEQELDLAEQELDSVRNCLDSVTESQASVDSGLPHSPPPPPVPPRFEPENVIPPPIPPVPKTNQQELPQEVVRIEGNFTSYLAETEVQNHEEPPQVTKEDISAALLENGIQSWMWNDNSGMVSCACSAQLLLPMRRSTPLSWQLKKRCVS